MTEFSHVNDVVTSVGLSESSNLFKQEVIVQHLILKLTDKKQ